MNPAEETLWDLVLQRLRFALQLLKNRGITISDNLEKVEVTGDLDLRYLEIEELPEGLQVVGNLDLRDTAITELPEGLKVGGKLYIRYTNITEIPQHLVSKVVR